MESRKGIAAAFRCNVQAAGLFVLVLAFCLFLAPAPDYAKTVSAPPRIIAGVVQSVGAGSLTVNTNHYDVSRAKFVTVDGDKTYLSLIKPGDRVAIVLEEGEVVMVRVDNRKIVK